MLVWIFNFPQRRRNRRSARRRLHGHRRRQRQRRRALDFALVRRARLYRRRKQPQRPACPLLQLEPRNQTLQARRGSYFGFDGRFGTMSSTSIAAPRVAGFAAYLFTLQRTPPDRICARIQNPVTRNIVCKASGSQNLLVYNEAWLLSLSSSTLRVSSWSTRV
jgi:hypothetical protein